MELIELKNALQKLTKKELIDLVADIAKQDTFLKDRLIATYSASKPKQELKLYQKWFDTTAKKHGDRHGFIDYRSSAGFARDVMEILDKAEQAENLLLGMDIAFLVLENTIASLQYTDDSNGDIGLIVAEALEVIASHAREARACGFAKSDVLVDKLLVFCESKEFEEWGEYRLNLLGLSTELADHPECVRKINSRISSLLEKISGDRYKTYEIEQLLHMRFQLVKAHGSSEEEEKFLREHLSYPIFRREAIQRGISQGDFHAVLMLAMNGEKKDREFPGLVNEWKKVRYNAYKHLSMTNEQKLLGQELLRGGDFEYYNDLEALAGDNAEEFYRTTLEDMKQSSDWRTKQVYLRLIEEKNDVNEMLDYVRKDPSTIEHYLSKLLPQYEKEALLHFRTHVEEQASYASNRKQYQQVCRILKRYKKVAGEEASSNIIQKLKMLNANKPAFLDELGKVK